MNNIIFSIALLMITANLFAPSVPLPASLKRVDWSAHARKNVKTNSSVRGARPVINTKRTSVPQRKRAVDTTAPHPFKGVPGVKHPRLQRRAGIKIAQHNQPPTPGRYRYTIGAERKARLDTAKNKGSTAGISPQNRPKSGR